MISMHKFQFEIKHENSDEHAEKSSLLLEIVFCFKESVSCFNL